MAGVRLIREPVHQPLLEFLPTAPGDYVVVYTAKGDGGRDWLFASVFSEGRA